MPELIVPEPKKRQPFETPAEQAKREAWERETLRAGFDPDYLNEMAADADSGLFEPEP